MNPFEQKVKKSRPGSYKAYVEESVVDMNVSDSKMVEVKESDRVTFRMYINKLGHQLDMKFSTLLDIDGNMWVKRVK